MTQVCDPNDMHTKSHRDLHTFEIRYGSELEWAVGKKIAKKLVLPLDIEAELCRVKVSRFELTVDRKLLSAGTLRIQVKEVRINWLWRLFFTPHFLLNLSSPLGYVLDSEKSLRSVVESAFPARGKWSNTDPVEL